MAIARIDKLGRLTLSEESLRALNLNPGDKGAVHIVAGDVILTGEGDKPNVSMSPFGLFTEWADEADCRAFDNL